MQKVIQKQNEEAVIDINECTEDSYYGILLSTDGGYWCKGFIFKAEVDKFVPVTFEVTKGKTWRNYCGRTLIDCLKTIMTSNKLTVYKFDGPEAMFRWISDNPYPPSIS